MSGKRPIRVPPADFNERNIPSRRLRNSVFYRIHRHGTAIVLHTHSPNHRFSHPKLPVLVLYAGKDFETCALEVFGDTLLETNMDISHSRWISTSCSRLEITTKVCDLTNTRVRFACGVDLATLLSTDLSIPHQWGLAIANHPAEFGGILYPSRFTKKMCIALFDRTPPSGMVSKPEFDLSENNATCSGFLDKYRIRLI